MSFRARLLFSRRDAVRLADGYEVDVTGPFEASLAAWARKVALPYDTYKALSDSLRQGAFSTALALRPSQLADLQKLVEGAQRFGLPLKELLPRLDEVFARYGGVQGVPAYRLELVFRQNWINEINAGRYAFQFSQDGRDRSPLWRFQAVRDKRTDDQCLRLHGLTFDKNDAVGRRFLPPIHFNCRCLAVDVDEPLDEVAPVNARAILAAGVTPDEGFDFDKAWVPAFAGLPS